MENVKETLNELLVDLFNHILVLEEKNLQDRGISLSMTEVHTLENIQKSKTKTMSDVARLQLITQGTLTVAVNRLQEKGYVSRLQDAQDKRIIRLSLTAKALDVLAIHDKFHEEMIDSFISDLKIDQDVALITSLRRIMEYFRQNYEDR
ncbi:MAG: MarR family transcriptional regulator [Erysipelotrichaceae bacterium]|nr:MarR family transcriptional regulator [Erysipelotrichaceae bacterium]MDP3304471.1 MarR family transcriptional regulator [Erysipelotrichaceae bacterium]